MPIRESYVNAANTICIIRISFAVRRGSRHELAEWQIGIIFQIFSISPQFWPTSTSTLIGTFNL